MVKPTICVEDSTLICDTVSAEISAEVSVENCAEVSAEVAVNDKAVMLAVPRPAIEVVPIAVICAADNAETAEEGRAATVADVKPSIAVALRAAIPLAVKTPASAVVRPRICREVSTLNWVAVSAENSLLPMAEICVELRPEMPLTERAVILVEPKPASAAVCRAETCEDVRELTCA